MKSLQEFGIEIIFLIGGLAGGIVSLTTKPKNMTRKQQFLTVIAGGFTANYLTPLVGDWLGLTDKSLYGIAFVLGYTGLVSVELIIKRFHSKVGS